MGSFLRHRAGLAASCAAGAAAGLLAGRQLPVSTALLVGWCAAATAHLALSVRAMARTTPEALRRRAALLEDEKWAVLGGALAAAVASLGGVAADLAAAPRGPSFGSAALAALTVALSWAFVHVLLAQHYMHEYWLAGGAGLVFPGSDRPGAGEFLYLAFCVGMTCQVSDVTTSSAAMRRLVLLHALVAFLFNTVILAAAVNIAAGVVR